MTRTKSSDYAKTLASQAESLDKSFDPEVIHKRIKAACVERMQRAHREGATRMDAFTVHRVAGTLQIRGTSYPSAPSPSNPIMSLGAAIAYFPEVSKQATTLGPMFAQLIHRATFHLLGAEPYVDNAASKLCSALAREEAQWHRNHGMELPPGVVAASERLQIDEATAPPQSSARRPTRV